MNNLQTQTPLEKLISDKQRILRECSFQEQKLNDDFLYIQDNASSLLLSGISSLLFPKTKAKSEKTDNNQPVAGVSPTTPLGLSDYLSVAQGLFPLAWDVARPLLVSWGIRKAQAWVIGKLFRKKK
jgi:hypothetical protein